MRMTNAWLRSYVVYAADYSVTHDPIATWQCYWHLLTDAAFMGKDSRLHGIQSVIA